MNFDFHTHGKLAKKFDFSVDYYMEMANHALQSGLDGVALTEHFNTKNFHEVYDTLDAHFPYEDGHYNIQGLKVFPGMEVDIKEVGHILCIGNRQDIRALRADLNDYTEEGTFIPFEKLLNFRLSYDMLVIGAHPYRESTPLKDLDPSLLKQLDAFDLNGKDLHTRGIEVNSMDVQNFAENLSKPVVGGSDTHHFKQFGAVYTVLDQECNTIAELKEAVINRQFHVKVAQDLPERVSEAIRLKAIEKEKLKKLSLEMRFS
ncbi:PHP domain-containing protein [Neobacillus niacini]|uniref:PHP-associated domain-containing protein n=1 Tax=Neobacillus niacini TaxID=86668 RepID=UPI0021CB4837|nr:PHP domain-containing protein [Neobacillus niacini]MCM3767256.1 PHP domain-containing protein [Neobacillus niacini]